MPDAPNAFILSKLKPGGRGQHIGDAGDIAVDDTNLDGSAQGATNMQEIAQALDNLNISPQPVLRSGDISLRRVNGSAVAGSTTGEVAYGLNDDEKMFAVVLPTNTGSSPARTLLFSMTLPLVEVETNYKIFSADTNHLGGNINYNNVVAVQIKRAGTTLTMTRNGYAGASQSMVVYGLSANTDNVDTEAREAAAHALNAASHLRLIGAIGNLDQAHINEFFLVYRNAVNGPAGVSLANGGWGALWAERQYLSVPDHHASYQRSVTLGYNAWSAAADITAPPIISVIGSDDVGIPKRYDSTTTGRPSARGVVASSGDYHLAVSGSSYWWRRRDATSWNHRADTAHPPESLLLRNYTDLAAGETAVMPSQDTRRGAPPGTETGNAILFRHASSNVQTLYYDNLVSPAKSRFRQANRTFGPWRQVTYNVQPIDSGGTGADNADDARDNLGITAVGSDLPDISNLNFGIPNEFSRYPADATNRPDNQDGVVYTTSDRQIAVQDRAGQIYHRGKVTTFAAWGAATSQTKTATSDLNTIADGSIVYFDNTTSNVPTTTFNNETVPFTAGLAGRNGIYWFATDGDDFIFATEPGSGGSWFLAGGASLYPNEAIRPHDLAYAEGKAFIVDNTMDGVDTSTLPDGKFAIFFEKATGDEQQINWIDGSADWQRSIRTKTHAFDPWLPARIKDGETMWGGVWKSYTSTGGTPAQGQVRRIDNDTLEFGENDAETRTAMLAWTQASMGELLIDDLSYHVRASAPGGSSTLIRLHVDPDLPSTLPSTVVLRRTTTILGEGRARELFGSALGQSGVSSSAPNVLQLTLFRRQATEPDDPTISISDSGEVTPWPPTGYFTQPPSGATALWTLSMTATRSRGIWTVGTWVKTAESSVDIEYYGGTSLTSTHSWSRTSHNFNIRYRIRGTDGQWREFDISGHGRLASLRIPATTAGQYTYNFNSFDVRDAERVRFTIFTNRAAGTMYVTIPSTVIFAVTSSQAYSTTAGQSLYVVWGRDGLANVAVVSETASSPPLSTNYTACRLNFIGPSSGGTTVNGLSVFNTVGADLGSNVSIYVDLEF